MSDAEVPSAPDPEAPLRVTVVLPTAERRDYSLGGAALAKDLAMALANDTEIRKPQLSRCYLIHRGKILDMDQPLEPLVADSELVVYAVFQEVTDEEKRDLSARARAPRPSLDPEYSEEEDGQAEVPLVQAEWPNLTARFTPGGFEYLDPPEGGEIQRVELRLFGAIFWFLVGAYFGFPVTFLLICFVRMRPHSLAWLLLGNIVGVVAGWHSLRLW